MLSLPVTGTLSALPTCFSDPPALASTCFYQQPESSNTTRRLHDTVPLEADVARAFQAVHLLAVVDSVSQCVSRHNTYYIPDSCCRGSASYRSNCIRPILSLAVDLLSGEDSAGSETSHTVIPAVVVTIQTPLV